MEIIVQGHKIDTKEIYDIEYVSTGYRVDVVVKLIDKPKISVGRAIPYDSTPMTISGYKEPYKRLYNELKEKWEADKTDIPVFKL